MPERGGGVMPFWPTEGLTNPNKPQSESEKFFAHLNNGGKLLISSNGQGDFQVGLVITPKEAGE